MQTISLWIKTYIYPLLLTLLVGILVGANYTPGTILSGWDTLHPEFNLQLAFSRVFTGVWRADQGLGAVAMQSHMAELPRLIYLSLASLVLPLDTLRYSYFFLMLLAGSLGMYALINKILKNKISAFIGALIYLCNFATVQHFAVPLEMFATQYGLLPWIVFVIIIFLEKPTKTIAVALFLLSFVASTQAHTATLLYAFLLEIFLLLSIYGLLNREHFKRTLIVLGIIILPNLYIIFPNLYATKTHGLDVANSKVNRLFTPEAFAKNQYFGTVENAAILKNFLFDWKLFDSSTQQFVPVLGPWIELSKNPLVKATGYVVFLLSLIGFVMVLIKKQRTLLPFAPLYIVSFFMLLNGTWPMPSLFEFVGTFAPVLKEALRFPFTKFSILFTVGIAIFASYAIAQISKKILPIILAVGLLFSFLPAFTGNLISPEMKIHIPTEYFEMFSWFNNQDHNKRVAILPIHSFWNWTYYKWGYQGAGFLQFGIPQPILDRDYDRWCPYNEQYAQEMSYAVYSQNPATIANVLTKYNVTWVLVDNSVFAPGSNENQTLLWLLPDMLTQAGLSEVKKFGTDITIYKTPNDKPNINGYKTLPQSVIHPMFTLTNRQERVTDPIQGALIAQNPGRRYVSVNVPDVDYINFASLDHMNNYVLEITSKHSVGFPLQLCISNNLTSHCDLSVHLGRQKEFVTERFVLPNLSDFGSGYALNFKNFTINGMTSDNEISDIRVLQINEFPGTESVAADLPITENVRQLSPVLYKATVNSEAKSLVLNQSHENGWLAYNTTTKQLLPHVLVNNWANGWTLSTINDPSSTIYIFFWPQILQWIGFALLPAGIIVGVKNL